MASAGEREFPAFPFEPYPIQLQLMRAVHLALQRGGVAIVESPTGTGKTLSLICSVLQWLQDQQQSMGALSCPGASHKPAANDEPDWMRDFSHEASNNQLKTSRMSNTTRVFRDGKNFFFAQHAQDQRANEKARLACTNASSSVDDDEDFLLKDYDSGRDCDSINAKKRKSLNDMANENTDDSSEEEEGENEQPLKVFFCSRTHSQLSQFVKELQRTAFSTALKTVSMGSRKSLCINPDVAKLKHSSRINERCLELQRSKITKSAGKKVLLNEGKKGRKKAQGCPMMSKQSHQRAFKEMAWESEVLDIEDLVKLGEKLGTCPYYASRRMVPLADLVVLPYQSMLHCPTREAIGLKLKGCVVVIDEAHNLVDSISNMHGCQVSEMQLRQVQLLLNTYLAKFRELLGAGNRRYIQILLLLIKALLNQIATADNTADVLKDKLGHDLRTNVNHNEKNGKILTINDFLFLLDIDNVNMFKLWQYMKESNIVHKVSSYAEKVALQEASLQSLKHDHGKVTPNITGTITSFHALAELILALMNADADGRVLLVPRSGSCDDGHEAHIKFVLLNAARAFMEVVDQAHAVILAGGTLQPIEELRYRLFPHLHENRIHHFSCGHIVPAENVLAIAVARGPAGKVFDFTFQSRSLPETMEELGRLLFNVCLVVPEGVVVFLPSFDYEQQLHSAWKRNGILEKLEKKKALFREPKDAASVELTLQEYKKTVEGGASRSAGRTGGILLCIVGGKMSEGINFSDGMGRCVIMVGLPYPSPSDPELVERMKFIDTFFNTPSTTTDQSSGLPPLRCSTYRGRDYYENLCMKAVNQSIGRAIRHKGDYASILLVDARYTCSSSSSATSRQVAKLPSWIKDRLFSVTGNFGEVQKLLHHFFKAKSSHTS